jgi:hypothetical protein
MLLFALAAAAVSPSPQSSPPAPVVVQARATVRIISGARIKLGATQNSDAPAAHDTVVNTNGTTQPAKLVEFE